MLEIILIFALLLVIIMIFTYRGKKVIIFGEDYIETRLINNLHNQFESVKSPIRGRITWACKISEGIYALCNEPENTVILWKKINNMVLDTYNLILKTPVCCNIINHKLYVCCFGTINGTSGIEIIDLENREIATYSYHSDELHHLHHVVEMNGRIIVCDIGDPWPKTGKIVLGNGLIEFKGGRFNNLTDDKFNSRKVLSIGNYTYTIGQKPTELVVLNHNYEVMQKHTFVEKGGDGGADIFYFNGFIYISVRYKDGGKVFILNKKADKIINTETTGNNPRYTNVLTNGYILSCNQDDNTITFFTENQIVISSKTYVNKPSFFLEE